MGQPLSQMEKEAASFRQGVSVARKIFGKARTLVTHAPGGDLETGLQTLARRAKNPLEALREGWESMTPGAAMVEESARRLQKVKELMARGMSKRQALDKLGPTMEEAIRAGKGTEWFGSGSAKHLLEGSQDILGRKGTLTGKGRGLGDRLSGTFEELSRRGYTGRGRVTKYMPIGGKGLMTGFTAASIPAVLEAEAPTRTGEDAAVERALDASLGAAGFIAGAGAGLPGVALGFGTAHAGKRMGRIIDRMRAGATLPDAVLAPSPRDIEKHRERIEKYYG